MITASVFVSCSNDDDPADFSDENIQHGPICGLLIGRFGGFAPSECNYGIISYILVRDFITLLLYYLAQLNSAPLFLRFNGRIENNGSLEFRTMHGDGVFGGLYKFS